MCQHQNLQSAKNKTKPKEELDGHLCPHLQEGTWENFPPKNHGVTFSNEVQPLSYLRSYAHPPKKLEKSHHLVIHPTIPWIYHPVTVENEAFHKYLVDGWATRLKKYSSSNRESFPQTGWTEQEHLKPPSGYLWLIIPKNQIWEHQINGHMHVLFLGTSPNLPTYRYGKSL